MKTKFSRVLLLLAMLILVVSASVVYGASGTNEDTGVQPTASVMNDVQHEYIAINGDEVVLDLENDGTATVAVVAKDAFTYFGIEGNWSVKEVEDTSNLVLTGIDLTNVTINNDYDVLDAATGKVLWVDDNDGTMDGVTLGNGGSIMTATYKVDKNTPDGAYKVKFSLEVFSVGTADPDEEGYEFEATINVTHECSGDKTDEVPATCNSFGVHEYYHCVRCDKYYSDEECTEVITNLETWKDTDGRIAKLDHSYTGEIKNDGESGHSFKCVNGCDAYGAAAEHDFTNGDCECGEAKPVTGGLKGDVNLDGVVDSDDITLLARHVYGIEIITNETALINSDVNDDDVVDSDDITKLARYVYGIIQNWDQE